MADLTMDDVLNYIDNMKVIELAELVKKIEEKYGVTAAAPVAAAAPGAAAGAAPAEEKTAFDVILVGAGDKKFRSSR